MIADDHEVSRFGLRDLLEESFEARVVAETKTPEETTEALKSLTPTFLSLDLEFPEGSGLEVLRAIREKNLSVRTLVFSAYREDRKVTGALELGADGYVLKSAHPDQIEEAIRTVVSGNRYLPPEIPDRILGRALSPKAGEDGSETESLGYDRFEQMTPREREVLRLVVEGLSSQEIGESLSVSSRTVDKHRENLKRKLGVSRTIDAVALALRHGVFDPSSLEGK